MFELHHKKAGLIFSFFHPLKYARKEFKSCHYRNTHFIGEKFYNEFDKDKNYSNLFRKTDGKAYNDKQLELIHFGISPANACYLHISRHHINAVLGLLEQNINIYFINNQFIKIQSAEWYQLDLMSLGLDITSSLAVNKLDDYESIVTKFDDGINIKRAYNELLEEASRPALRIK